MKSLKLKSIAVAVLASLVGTSALLVPSYASASGAVAGATEYTQLGSWLQNFKNFTDQITNMRAQLATVTSTLDVAKQMREQLSSVTGLVRDGQEMLNTINEMRDMGREVQNAFGALDDLKNLSEQRFLEISRFKDQFGNARSVEDYFIESMRNNKREHQMNQVLRDNEASAIKRLESTGKAIQAHAAKIPTTVGVHQAVSLMSTQINNLAAMTADVNKITVARAAKQTDVEDRDAAIAKREMEKIEDQRKKTDELIRAHKAAFPSR
jgi:hypothetical protein